MTADQGTSKSTGETPGTAATWTVKAGRHTGQRARRSPLRRLSLSNWPVSARLIAVFAVASVTGLVFGGLRVTSAITSADADTQTARLAILGEQVTVLAQAVEDERDISAGVAAYQTLNSAAATNRAAPQIAAAIDLALKGEQQKLAAQENVTNAAVARTLPLANAIGAAYPASLQLKAATVVSQINALDALRSSVTDQKASLAIGNYSGALTDLFSFNDEIASDIGDALLSDETRALGALSRAKDQASQQRAIVFAALLESSVSDAGSASKAHNDIGGVRAFSDAGGVNAFTTAQGLEETDLLTFEQAAEPSQVPLFMNIVAGQEDTTAQMLGQFLSVAQDPQLTFEQVNGTPTLGFSRTTVSTTWYSTMSAVINQMHRVEGQVTGSIVARSQSLEHQAVESAILTSAATAAAVLIVLLATVLVTRSLVNPLRRLQADALEIATVRLPARVAAAASGSDSPQSPAVVEAIGVRSTDEIGRVARAFDHVHAEAVRLAGDEAQLRSSFNAMFISLSRRSVPLIDRLSRMIDAMEQNEDDPAQLGNLFAMDHLITRMRRNSENLLVLAGEEPVRKWTESVPLSDVARAAAAEIEQYHRVALAVQPGIMVSGQAAADVVHLLAELIENATLFSPQSTPVRVTVTELSSGGVLIEVRDDGVGVSASRLADMNWRLDHPPVVDVSVSRHMGLYAVSRLAARHGIRVKLRPGTPQGLSALVWLPDQLAKNEPDRVVGGHSGPAGVGVAVGADLAGAGADLAGAGADPVGAWADPAGNGAISLAASRPEAGRHRAGLLGARPHQPAFAGRDGPTGRPGSAWFIAKRPSGGPVKTPAEVAGGWRPAGGPVKPPAEVAADWRPPPPSSRADREPTSLTATGLPRRVPRTSAYPGAAPGDGGVSAAEVVLGAPPNTAEDGAQGAEHHGQAPPDRRSPEAVRSRLSGFQLGNRDAVQAGQAAGWGQHAGEENDR